MGEQNVDDDDDDDDENVCWDFPTKCGHKTEGMRFEQGMAPHTVQRKTDKEMSECTWTGLYRGCRFYQGGPETTSTRTYTKQK